jgi:hypothetical protein
MEALLAIFREGMTSIVSAEDDALVDRRIAVPPSSILPALKLLRDQIDREPADDRRVCRDIFESARDSEYGDNMLDPPCQGIDFPEDESLA